MGSLEELGKSSLIDGPIEGARGQQGQDSGHAPAASGKVQKGRIRLPSLGLHQSERRLLLVAGDLLLLGLALVVTLQLRTKLLDPSGALVTNWKWFATLLVIWLGAATVFDCYNLARAASTFYSVAAIVLAGLLATTVYQAIPWFTPVVQSRIQFFMFVILAVGMLATWRFAYARFFVQPTFQRRALIVGAGESGRALVKALRSTYAREDANPFRGTGYVLLGFIDDRPEYDGKFVAGLPVLGDSTQLAPLAGRLAVDEVVVAITHKHSIQPQLFEAILDCREMGLPVTTMTTVYERLTGRVAVEHASRDIETATGREEGLFVRFSRAIKWMVDIVSVVLGALGVAVLFPLVWLGNRLTSPGPMFYWQERVGRGGRTFMLVKFRSMNANAEEKGAVWAANGDERVTPVGRVLRKTHLDELPQVYNILKGDMALVGPRPERPEFVEQLSQQIPFYRARHCVKPGITGWAQIHQNYGDSVEGAKEKLEYDLYYVKKANLLLDTVIILRTLTKVGGMEGR